MIKYDSVFYCTRQVWKLWVMYVGAFIAIPLMAATEWFKGSLPGRYHALLMLCGGLLALGSLAFPCIAIKCPVCGARWFWLAVNGKRAGRGVRWLFAQTACPVCSRSCQEFMHLRMGE